jgi:hypothetical protein
MKINNILTASILAIAGLVAFTPSAHAATLFFGDNELMLGFRATGGTGAASNVMSDLNTADLYYNPNGTASNPLSPITGTNITNIGRLSPADLSATYGAGWAARTDLFWGIVGSSGSSGSNDGLYQSNTIYLSKAEATAGTQTSPWNRQNDYTNANVQISSMGNAGGYQGSSTANSNFDAIASAANAQSYTSRSQGQSGQTFATVNGTFANDSVVAKFATGNWISVQDIYAMDPAGTGGNGVYLGSFGLRADGTIDYATSASDFATSPVPEPATTFFGIATFAVAAFRRRRSAPVATA